MIVAIYLQHYNWYDDISKTIPLLLVLTVDLGLYSFSRFTFPIQTYYYDTMRLRSHSPHITVIQNMLKEVFDLNFLLSFHSSLLQQPERQRENGRRRDGDASKLQVIRQTTRIPGLSVMIRLTGSWAIIAVALDPSFEKQANRTLVQNQVRMANSEPNAAELRVLQVTVFVN